MENLSLDFQWALAGRSLSQKALSKIKGNLSKSDLPLEVRALRAEDDTVQVLRSGWYADDRLVHSLNLYNPEGTLTDSCTVMITDPNLEQFFIGGTALLGVLTIGSSIRNYFDKSKLAKKIRTENAFEKTKSEILEANLKDAEILAQNIELYPESARKLEIKTPKKIIPIDTGTPNSHITAPSDFVLCAHAGALGANAVADYFKKIDIVYLNADLGLDSEKYKATITTSIGVPVKIE